MKHLLKTWKTEYPKNSIEEIKPMKKLTHLMIHCSATKENQHFTEEDIRRWHTSPVSQGGRGWSKPGYSEVFLLTGETRSLFNYDADDYVQSWEISNGASGWNGHTRHICYIGGVGSDGKPKDTRTDGQLISMATYIKLTLKLMPQLKLIGHNQVSAKACPSFDVRKWAKSIGIKDENIDSNLYVVNNFIS